MFQARKDIALESRNKHIYCEECDLASQDSVRKFAERVNQSKHIFPPYICMKILMYVLSVIFMCIIFPKAAW